VLASIPSGVVTLVAFLVMLGLLVLVHELGHFLTAIRLGIKVEEFGFGYPPRLMTLFERNGVKYTLNWLPIGGFVRFGGEGENIYGVGSLSNASPWKKIAVLLAGPLMNLVLAFLIFSALFAVNGVPTTFDGAQLGTVYPGTPAAAAGFKTGDVIISLDGQPIGQNLKAVSQAPQLHPGTPIIALIQRGDQRLTLQVTPGPWTTPEGEQRQLGFGFTYGNNVQNVPANLPHALVTGFNYTWEVLGRFIGGLGQLIGGLIGTNQPPPGGVTGIVGIARGTGEVIQRDGLLGFWQWTALISLNLFLINLLPIPALDGSHILFSLIEVIRRGKKIPPEKEAMVHAIGFMMLMGLMLIITFSDVANWISGAPALGGG
jgi:regulator of sigma E protease